MNLLNCKILDLPGHRLVLRAFRLRLTCDTSCFPNTVRASSTSWRALTVVYPFLDSIFNHIRVFIVFLKY